MGRRVGVRKRKGTLSISSLCLCMRSSTCCSSYVSATISRCGRWGERRTHLLLADGPKHILEKDLEVVFALAIEETDDAGDKGGADTVVVALCISGESVWLVETSDGRELSAGVGEAGGACLVVVAMERGGLGEGAQRGRGPEQGDRGRA